MAITSLNNNNAFNANTKDFNTANSFNSNNTDKIKEAASNLDAKSIMNGYAMQFEISITQITINFGIQSGIGNTASGKPMPTLDDILNGVGLSDIGYNGKPINQLTQEEAQELISEDGFFGVKNTSNRIADFVLAGAGDDIEKLKQGREGILKGYEMAEKAWGGELPDISKETIQKALEKIDQKISSLGANVLEQNA